MKSARVFLIWFRAFTCFRTWLKTYAKRCTNNSLLSCDKKKLFFVWINWSRAFDFRICFGKTIVAFDFDEKFTQSVAQIPMLYTCQKTFFACTLRLINLRTWLGNGRMQCKQKCSIKTMAVKVLSLILAFVYFAKFLLSVVAVQVVIII